MFRVVILFPKENIDKHRNPVSATQKRARQERGKIHEEVILTEKVSSYGYQLLIEPLTDRVFFLPIVDTYAQDSNGCGYPQDRSGNEGRSRHVQQCRIRHTKQLQADLITL